MRLPWRRRKALRPLFSIAEPVELPPRKNAVPNKPVSLPATFVGEAVRLNGVSHLPIHTLPKPPLKPTPLLRLQKSPSPAAAPRTSAVLAHWNHADKLPPSFSSPLKPISLPGVWISSTL